MPSLISHAAVGAAAAAATAPHAPVGGVWLLAVTCSVLPDADAIGSFLGVSYRSRFGHRGFFHSLFFGALASLFLSTIFLTGVPFLSLMWLLYSIFFFLLYALHAVLDTLTDGHLGVALLSPFSATRYHSRWRPIAISPMNPAVFLSRLGLRVMRNEIAWVWFPCGVLVLATMVLRALL